MGSIAELSKVSYWEKRYSEKQTQWYLSEAHDSLVKYMPLLASENSVKKFFLPLCGKSKDIPYLLSLGHRVFGIEGALQPILELEKENSLKLNFDKERSIYFTDDHQLEIYFGDIFACPIEQYGPFDCIWDRASFVALDYSTRPAYVEVMRRSVLRGDGSYHDFKYLFQAYNYDKSLYPGPPTSVDWKDMEQCFGDWADIKE
ncbi:unnamed protein product, partial [Allacma fusca]